MKRLLGTGCLTLALAAALGACSSPQTPTPQPEPQPTSTPEPEPTTEPTAEPTAAPTADASAPPTSTLPPPSGRPPVSFEGQEKIAENIGGSPMQKLELKKDGGAILRVPEYALKDAILLTFMIDKKGKKHKGAVGQVFHLFAQTPPSEDITPITSQGPAFTLRLPTGKSGAQNLAIGEVAKDDKGKETVTWKVLGPTKTEDGFATYEFTAFGNTYLHVTSEASTQ